MKKNVKSMRMFVGICLLVLSSLLLQANAQSTVFYEQILTFDSDKNVQVLTNDLLLVEDNGAFDIVNLNGHIVMSLSSDDAYSLNDHLNNYHSYVISKSLEDVIPLTSNGKWGAINSIGEKIIDFDYDWVSTHSDGIIVAYKGDTAGVFDLKGNLIIPFIYSDITIVDGGFILAEDESGYCFKYDFTGKKLSSFDEYSYGLTSGWSGNIRQVNGHLIVYNNKIINNSGELISEFDYSELMWLTENLLIARDSNNEGVIDLNGNVVIPVEYSNVYYISEELIGVVSNAGKYGIFNKDGEIVVPVKYSSNLHRVKVGENATTTDSGFQYVSNGFIIGEYNDEYGVFDKFGNIVIPFGKYNSFEYTGGSLITAYNENGIGVINANCEIVIPFEQRWIEVLSDDFIKVEKSGKWGVVSINNEAVLPFKYSDITYYEDENTMILRTFSDELIVLKIYPTIYDYDTIDDGVNVDVSNKLSNVTSIADAKKVIGTISSELNTEQKASATGRDKLTVLAEGAVANVASTTKSEDTIHITETVVKELEPKAVETAETLEKTLTDNGVNTQRTITKTVKVKSTSSKKTVKVVKDTAETAVDTVKVETDFASVSIPASAQTEFELTEQDTNKVAVTFDTDKTTTMKISFPGVTGDTTYMAVVDETGKAIGGKYNPATGELEAKISESGVYSVVYNEKDFEDIKDKSAEMQNAIKTLAAKGIINGTSETTFSPDASISRAEIAALIVRTLSKLDPNEDGGFVDVTKDNWFFGVAGSSRKHGIINGYEDNTFRGNNVILKEQIIAVTARVLRNEMNYKTPENVSEYLTYTDAESLPGWAKEDIALAEMANIVLQRVDGQFVPQDEMTRGDVAIILMRLFNKIW